MASSNSWNKRVIQTLCKQNIRTRLFGHRNLTKPWLLNIPLRLESSREKAHCWTRCLDIRIAQIALGPLMPTKRIWRDVPSGSSLANPPTSNLMPFSIGLLGSLDSWTCLTEASGLGESGSVDSRSVCWWNSVLFSIWTASNKHYLLCLTWRFHCCILLLEKKPLNCS